MYSRVQKMWGLFLIAVILFGVLASPAAANSAGFSASPRIPENQKKGSGYFNLAMTPGQEQDLLIAVENQGDQEITISVEAFTAITNSNGLISYSEIGMMDESLTHSFSELATVQTPELKIAPHSAENAVISIKMPEEQFDGIVLGGIQILKKLTQEELMQSDAVAHQYSYAIGAILSETDTPVEAEFQPGDVTVELVNERAAIVTEIRNVKSAMIKGVELVNEILSADGSVMMAVSLPNAEFAPNSVLRLSQLDEDGVGLAAGEYISRTTMHYNGQQWTNDSAFSIEPSAAQEVNESALNQGAASEIQSVSEGGGNSFGLPMILLIAIGAILLITAVILVGKYVRKARAEQREIEEQMKTLNEMRKGNL